MQPVGDSSGGPLAGWASPVLAASGEAAGLLAQLGLVILTLAVLARLAARFGMSPVPLYLLAGLAIGAGGPLELVDESVGFIETAAQIGVLLLLFMLGLEYSGQELFENLRAHGPAGGVDAVLNFTPGFGAALLLGWSPLSALVLGGVTYISSSGIVSKAVGDLGWIGNRETPVVLSILVIEDLAMALYLPVLTGLLGGERPLRTMLGVALALAVVAVMLFVAVRFGHHLSRAIFSHSDEVFLLTALGITMVAAGLAERLQASGPVTAFLFGIALSGPAAASATKLLSPLRDLFAGAFFLFFGLELDPAAIPAALPAALTLAVVCAATKLATGWWAAAQTGVRPFGRLRAGALLTARGEFSIVIAGLAVAAGIDDPVGALAAAYVLVLAVAGPLLARFSDPVSRRLFRPATTSAVSP